MSNCNKLYSNLLPIAAVTFPKYTVISKIVDGSR